MLCMGYLEDDWQGKLFLKTSSIAATSSSSGPEYWWQATVQWFPRVGTRVTGCIVLITFAPFYGGLLLFFVQQHKACGPAGRSQRLPPQHPHYLPKSCSRVFVLAYDLSN